MRHRAATAAAALRVGPAPLPPLPDQQEEPGRISGSKLDPGPEDEEALVTSLPTPHWPKITFLLERPSGTPRGWGWGGGQVLYTNTDELSSATLRAEQL